MVGFASGVLEGAGGVSCLLRDGVPTLDSTALLCMCWFQERQEVCQ